MTHIEALKNALQKSSFDSFIVSSEPGRTYLTGFSSTAGTVFVCGEDAFFFIDSRYIHDARHAVRGMEVRLSPSRNSAIGEIKELVRDRGISTVAFEEDYLTVSEYSSLEAALPETELAASGGLLTNLREIKDRHEVSMIVEAQRICERAFEKTLGVLRLGMTELELAAILNYNILAEGADGLSFPIILLSGENSAVPHGKPSGRRLCRGDFLLFDFGGVKNGYCSDMTRTVAIGEATPEMRLVYETVLSAQLAGIEAATAGSPKNAPHLAAASVISGAGFGLYFTHSFGHGVGVEIHESPTVSPSAGGIFSQGTVISAEPGIYLPGKFGVRIEDLLFLAPDGTENLTNTPKELMILPV